MDADDPLRGDAVLRAMFAASPIGIALTDADGRVLRCNPALKRLLGYREDELVRLAPADFTHPDDVGADPSVREQRFVRKDGATVRTRVTVSLARPSADAPPIVIRMVEEIGEAFKVMQACGRLVLDASLELPELLARVAALLPPAMQHPAVTVGRIRYGDAEATTPGYRSSPWRLEARFRTVDGTEGTIEVAYVEPAWPPGVDPFLSEERALLDALCDLLRAAMDRRLADQALRAANERLDLALRAGLAGVWEWDVERNRVRWSAHLAELVGRQGEMHGDFGEFLHLIHGDDRDRLKREVLDAVARGANRCDTEFRLLHPSGPRRMIGVFQILRDAGGRPLRLLGIGCDVTARRQLEERVRHGQRVEAMGQLAAGVAHDFNNLLSVLMSSGELLLRPLPPAEVHALGTEIVEAGTRGVALTRQLLAFSRKAAFAPAALDLNRLLLELEPMLRRLAGPGVKLCLELDPAVGRVWADAIGLDEVAMNLVVNARDAMPDGGEVTIATSLDGADAILAVSDTGTGIPEEIRAQIFEPFFTTKEDGQGTGLGLAVVVGVVEQSKGHVTVESELGRGTTFRVFLPQLRA